MSPFLLRFITYRGGGPRWLWFMLRWATMGGTVVLAAQFAGGLELRDSHGGLVLTQDLQRILLVGSRSTETPHEFPLVRDYATWIHVWMIGCISLWARDFFEAIGNILSRMSRSGALVIHDTATFFDCLIKVNSRLTSKNVSFWFAVAAVILVGSGEWALWHSGIYAFFAPSSVAPNSFSVEVYDTWWARWNSPGMLAYSVWGAVGNYINLWVIYVAGEAALFFWTVRRSVSFSIDLSNSDGTWGWGSVQDTIMIGRKIAIAASLGVAAIALIANSSGYYYLAFFPLAFVTSILLFLVPNQFYLRGRRAFIVRSAPTDPVERRIESIQRALVPQHLVRTRDFIYQTLVTALPGILAIIGAIRGDS